MCLSRLPVKVKDSIHPNVQILLLLIELGVAFNWLGYSLCLLSWINGIGWHRYPCQKTASLKCYSYFQVKQYVKLVGFSALSATFLHLVATSNCSDINTVICLSVFAFSGGSLLGRKRRHSQWCILLNSTKRSPLRWALIGFCAAYSSGFAGCTARERVGCWCMLAFKFSFSYFFDQDLDFSICETAELGTAMNILCACGHKIVYLCTYTNRPGVVFFKCRMTSEISGNISYLCERILHTRWTFWCCVWSFMVYSAKLFMIRCRYIECVNVQTWEGSKARPLILCLS